MNESASRHDGSSEKELVLGSRRLRGKLAGRYEKLVAASSRQHGRTLPTSVERYFMSLTGFEYIEAIRRFVGDKQRVLLVGDGGGRDYYSLRQLGKDVSVIDIAPQRVIPELMIADITQELPFPANSFDAVVMAEVIEHLFDDVKALENARHVLKDDGVLVLTVPFLHDEPDYHVRVHTELSLRRLLSHTGWVVTDCEIKGGGLAWLDTKLPVRVVKHAVNYASWILLNRLWYETWNRSLAKLDKRVPRWVHARSPYYGAFVRVVKGPRGDYTALNVSEFTDFQTP